MSSAPIPAAPSSPSGQQVKPYHLTTSEPLSEGGKVVTLTDNTGRIVWTKTRELDSESEEIIDTLYDSAHHPRWTLHRPVEGWYIILRRFASEEGAEGYIQLEPGPGPGARGTLEFTLPAFSPPRSPPTSRSTEEKSRSTTLTIDDTAPAPSLPPTGRSYRLHPIPPPPPAQSTLVTTVIKNLFIGQGIHFACSGNRAEQSGDNVVDPVPILLTFSEHPSYSLSTSTSGTLTLHPSTLNRTGLEPSFWALLAMGYLDFLEEGKGWEVAQGG